MVCREAQIGSAATSYVLQTTALEEQQVLSLYHEVMREGRTAGVPSRSQTTALVGAFSTLVEADTNLSDARRRSILSRLERSRSEAMNGQRFYATSRLIERANRAETAMSEYVAASARDLGVSEAEVRSRIDRIRTDAGRDRTERPTTGFVDQMRNDPSYANLPLDRQTAVAVEAVNAARTAARDSQPTRTTVTRQPISNSSSVAEMGYDPATGRVEVVLHNSPGVPYAYRMTPGEYEAFRGARSVGSYYARHVRGNDNYRYATADAAAAAGTQIQCPTCGQFEGDSHSCPPRDSAEERNRTERLARRSARRVIPTNPDTTPPPRRTSRRVVLPEPTTEPVRLGGTRRRYHGDSGSFRTVSLTDVQQTARRNSAGAVVPVGASVSYVSGTNGAQAVRTGHVTGSVQVTYNGRGLGYTAVAVTEPGDSGDDQLRCNCADYRRVYDCVHVRQTVQDMNNRINQDSLRAHHGLGQAIEQVNAELAQDRAESIAAQETSRETWQESPVSYTNDHAAFQADYRAAKARLAAGEPVVPYMTENATDGLGARGTGRAFGVELEFDVGPGVDHSTMLRNIGRELHALGLTTRPGQSHYHAAESRGYTEDHQGGWSFEQDCTVAGEIVSPIMYDTPETWENLQKVCDIIKNNGGVVTQRTGSHVHVSAHNYDHTVANHNRLLGAFAENEDTIYRLSSDATRGTHRGVRWCSPNRVPTAGYTDINQARYSNNSHNLGLNMQSVAGAQSDHIEFRTYDASLEPSVIQTQIKLSLGITEAAFRDTDYQPGAHQDIGSHRAHNNQTHGSTRRLTGEAWQQDTAGYRSFADRIFRRAEDKAQMTALFAITKWQRGGSR